MRFLLYTIMLAISTGMLGNGPVGAEEVDDTHYRDRSLGLSVTAPEDWVVTRQTGYPDILAIMLPAAGDGMISISLAQLGAGQGLANFVQQNRHAMEQVGITIVTSAAPRSDDQLHWDLKGFNPTSRWHLRQYYLADRNRVIVLTLTAPANRMEPYSAQLNVVLDLLEVADPARSVATGVWLDADGEKDKEPGGGTKRPR
jgi:hypothetical protein